MVLAALAGALFGASGALAHGGSSLATAGGGAGDRGPESPARGVGADGTSGTVGQPTPGSDSSTPAGTDGGGAGSLFVRGSSGGQGWDGGGGGEQGGGYGGGPGGGGGSYGGGHGSYGAGGGSGGAQCANRDSDIQQPDQPGLDGQCHQ